MVTRKAHAVEVDFAGVESGGGRPVDDGEYLAQVSKIEEKEGESSGQPYLAWQWKIVEEGEAKGATAYDNTSLTPQSLWRLRSLLECIGIEVPAGKMRLVLDQLVGKRCRLHDASRVENRGSTGEAMRKIVFVGLGNMGAPMATNLVKAGYEVHGYDLAPENVDAATRAGIVPAASVAAVVEKAEAVVTMLPAGAHVLNVCRNFLPHAEPGTLLIDCSTIDVASARQAHDLARARGCLSVDAPVSGGTGGAIAGTLTFKCGGDEDAVGRARPMLEAMGRKVVHCGTGGNGQAAKICNNMILGISMIAVSEACVLGEKLGLSHQALFDVASTSSGQCWSLTTYCPVPGPVPTSPANHEYKAGFAAALLPKRVHEKSISHHLCFIILN